MNVRLGIVACICCGIVFAQIKESPAPLHKTFDRPHQLRDFVIELQLSGWPVSFEEGPVISAAELVQKTSPSGIPVLVKRVVPLTIDLSSNQLAAKDNETRKAVIESVLSSYAASGNRDDYDVLSHGKYLQIVPLQIIGSEGTLQRFEPVLDTNISFPEQRFDSLYGLVQTVVDQVSQKRGVPIALGNVPSNLFRQSSVVEVATNERARDVLSRAFAEINGPRLAEQLNPVALPWTLSYDATSRQYWFGVNVISMQLAGVPGREVQMPDSVGQLSTGAPHTIQKNDPTLKH